MIITFLWSYSICCGSYRLTLWFQFWEWTNLRNFNSSSESKMSKLVNWHNGILRQMHFALKNQSMGWGIQWGRKNFVVGICCLFQLINLPWVNHLEGFCGCCGLVTVSGGTQQSAVPAWLWPTLLTAKTPAFSALLSHSDFSSVLPSFLLFMKGCRVAVVHDVLWKLLLSDHHFECSRDHSVFKKK